MPNTNSQIAKELKVFKSFKQFELLAKYSLALSKQSKSWLQKIGATHG